MHGPLSARSQVAAEVLQQPRGSGPCRQAYPDEGGRPDGEHGGGGGDAGRGAARLRRDHVFHKRKRPAGLFATPSVSKKKDDEQAQRMADSGFFGDDSEGDGDSDKTGPCKLTLREVCQQEFDRFQERFKSTKAKDYPLSVLLSFWAGEGRAPYPNMARVARVLLSVPASAAVLERDFSTAGRLITGSRSLLAGEYVEMTLFLNGNTGYIPVEVPSLSESQMKEAVPRRLTNPRAEVAALSTGVEDVVPVVVFDANIDDEYAAEATSV